MWMENQSQKEMIYIHSTDQTFTICVYIPRCVHTQLLSRVQLFMTPWTVAHQAPLCMGFSRQEYWSRLPFPSPYRSMLYQYSVIAKVFFNI